jgi:hypothetical protein
MNNAPLTSHGQREVLASLREGRSTLAEMRESAQRHQAKFEMRGAKLTKALATVDYLIGKIESEAEKWAS